MSNYLNIAKVLPFKFYKNTPTPGIHFDDDWACNQIRNWEKRVYYAQKWLRAYTTKLQIITTGSNTFMLWYPSTGYSVAKIV